MDDLHGTPEENQPMNTSTRITIVDHAIRWTSNILVEVLGNHGKAIPPSARDALRTAVEALSVASTELVSGEPAKRADGLTPFKPGRALDADRKGLNLEERPSTYVPPARTQVLGRSEMARKKPGT